MKIAVRYDVGDGPETQQISPRAMIGWELANKKQASDLSEGFSVNDLVEMLWQQLKIEPEPRYGSKAALVNSLLDIDPEVVKDPTAEPDPQEALFE